MSAIVTHDLDTLAPGKCRYGFLCNEAGGVIDDLIVYCLDTDSYMLVVNAARITIDFDCIKARLPEGLVFTDDSEATAKIDLQGPLAYEVLRDRVPGDCSRLKYFNFTWTEFAGAKVLISRTGYTGELGYELFLPATAALALWEALAADPRVLPAGLGARDTIRLEMGYPLYGQDLDEEHTPAEAGYGWLLTSPAEYVGKGKAARLDAKLLALEIPGRRSARHECRPCRENHRYPPRPGQRPGHPGPPLPARRRRQARRHPGRLPGALAQDREPVRQGHCFLRRVFHEKRLTSLIHILQSDVTSVQKFLDAALEEAIDFTSSEIGYIYHYNDEKCEFVLNSWART